MRTKKGVITSAKMQNTVVVTVHAYMNHPVYGKRFRRSKKFMADTNGQDVYEGDLVIISECRPLSKNKRFKVTEIVQHAPRVSEIQEEAGLGTLTKQEKSQEEKDATPKSDS